MHQPRQSEDFVRAFHTTRRRATSRAFQRGGSYHRFASRISTSSRVLDLACGDGALLQHLGASAIGIDLVHADLVGVSRACQARAQALPFADGSFDTVACHLAFMLFDEIETVVAEIDRVLVPGGQFVALLGGGPTADGDDAFHRFAAMLPRSQRLGDPRAKTEGGWHHLFQRWNTVEPFERWTLDLSGSFAEVWAFLGASYEATPDMETRLRDATAELGDRVPCTVVTWFARAVK